MKRFLIVLLILMPVLSMAQLSNIETTPSSNFKYRDKKKVSNLIDKFNQYVYYPYGTYDLSETVIPGESIGGGIWRSGSYYINNTSSIQGGLFLTHDTVYLSGTRYVSMNERMLNVYSDDDFEGVFNASTLVPYIRNFTTTKALGGRVLGLLLYPNENDTIRVPSLTSVRSTMQSWTPSATNRIDLGLMRNLYVYTHLDNYLQVDSLAQLHIEVRDNGIPDDSLDAYYGIYHQSDLGGTATGREYFAYSEKGDLFLGGGGGIDQYGFSVKIGGDLSDYTARTNSTTKNGVVKFPHYTNSEEDFTGLFGMSTSTNNIIGIGGGSSGLNAATRINFTVAENTTTTAGTTVAKFESTGLEIVSGAIKQVQMTGSLTDGTPTDAEIDAIVGDTPANMGAGWTVTILDSDGTGLMYRVESDGTNWGYQQLTTAL